VSFFGEFEPCLGFSKMICFCLVGDSTFVFKAAADFREASCLRADCPAEVSLGAVAGLIAYRCSGCLVWLDYGLRLFMFTLCYLLELVGGDTPGFLLPKIYPVSLRCELIDPLDLSF
jgi:hypothetical protein